MRKERIFDDAGHLKEDVPIHPWFVPLTCCRFRIRVPVVAKSGSPLSSIGMAPLISTPKIRRRRVVAASVMGIVILTVRVSVRVALARIFIIFRLRIIIVRMGVLNLFRKENPGRCLCVGRDVNSLLCLQ